VGCRIALFCYNNNDNDKRLGFTAKADQRTNPITKKYNTPKNKKMDNEAVQKLQTSL